MKRFLLLGISLFILCLTPVNAQPDAAKQDVEITNSYLNIKSVNKRGDANVQKVKIDKCFLSIIRINLGDKEVPVELEK